MTKSAYRRVHTDKGGPLPAKRYRSYDERIGRRAYIESATELERQFENAVQKSRDQLVSRMGRNASA